MAALVPALPRLLAHNHVGTLKEHVSSRWMCAWLPSQDCLRAATRATYKRRRLLEGCRRDCSQKVA